MSTPKPMGKIAYWLDHGRKSPDSLIRFFIDKLWREFRSVFLLLFYCRWSVLVIAVGGGFLLFSPQGQEIAVRAPSSPLHLLAVLFGSSFWAFHIWLASRLMLIKLYGKPKDIADPDLKRLVENFPRLLSLTAYLLASAAFFLAWLRLSGEFLVLFLSLFFLLLCWPYFKLLENRKQLMRQYLSGYQEDDDLAIVVSAAVPLTVLYSVVFFVWVWVAPVSFGFGLGSLGIVFFALSSILATGSWLNLRAMDLFNNKEKASHASTTACSATCSRYLKYLQYLLLAVAILLVAYHFGLVGLAGLSLVGLYVWWAHKILHPFPDLGKGRQTVPVLAMLVGIALLFSLFNLNDNHRLSTLGKPNAPTVPAFAEQWFKQAQGTGGQTKPLVIVATAGGGIRAAYWTGAVLSEIMDERPGFRQSLFAISGVSGGSVGAAVFNATLGEAGAQCAKSAPDQHCLKDKVLQALSEDFLAPTVASMLYPDLAQRFLPFPLLPDRAAALESAWQTAWAKAMGKPGTAGLQTALSEASPVGGGKAWMPALLLNSTHVETGKRVVASSLSLAEPAFRDAVDLLNLMGKDVSIGTAALNSARFTYVSPPGTLPCSDKQGGYLKSVWCDNGHVVDGGYFENFGAVTALQLLQAVNKTLEGKPVRPIIILISNDHNLAKPGQAIEDDAPPDSLPSEGFANETLGPVRALLATREARGILATKDLRAAVGPQNFFHFRMDLAEGQIEPALGWVLSKQSEAMMGKLMQTSQINKQELTRLLAALDGRE